MTQQEQVWGLVKVSDLLTSKGADSYWIGTSLESIRKLLGGLPLSLSGKQGYLFTLEGNNLTISPTQRALTNYQVLDSEAIRGFKVSAGVIALKLATAGKILNVRLAESPIEIPKNAKSLGNVYAPVDLLDEYVTLTNKVQSGEVSAAEQKRRNELLTLIGKEYVQREREKEAALDSNRPKKSSSVSDPNQTIPSYPVTKQEERRVSSWESPSWSMRGDENLGSVGESSRWATRGGG